MRSGSDLYTEVEQKMNWKSEVKIIKDDGIWLTLGKKKKQIAAEDIMIAELMESGVTEDDELLRRVSEVSEGDDIGAGFRLAQFVEDYGPYLAEARKPSVFGN